MSRRNINSLVYYVENYKIIPQWAAICTIFSFVHYKKYKPFMKHISVLILIVHFDISTPVKTIINIPGRRCRLFARKKNHGMGRKNDIFHDNWYFFIILGNVSLFFLPPWFLFLDTVVLFIYNIGFRAAEMDISTFFTTVPNDCLRHKIGYIRWYHSSISL